MANKYLQIDGIATFVQHSGVSTLPDLPPVFDQGESILCLHGSGGNGHLFSDLFDQLATAHRLVAFDQPGHGRSACLDSLGSIEKMAAFTGAFLDKVGASDPVLMGHDMGAAVALRSALERSDRIRALVLCAAGDRFDPGDASLELARRVSEGKERRPFDPSLFGELATPEIMKRAFMEGMKTDPRATYGDLLACRDWQDAARLPDITIPTLIVHGEAEIPRVKEGAAALAEAMPTARLEIIPGAGHWIPLEAPEELAECISNFLGALE